MKEKTIHIFDLDSTLSINPEFAHLVKSDSKGIVDIESTDYKEYFTKVKSVFWDALSKDIFFKRSGDFIVPINTATGGPFPTSSLEYLNKGKEAGKMFLVHDDIIVLNPFPGFHKSPETLGWMMNEPIFDEYEKAGNRMILTGRDEELREMLLRVLRYNHVDFPNYGLKLFNPKHGMSIQQFKINEILQSIKQFGWTVIHFYEDRADWLNAANEAVNTMFPKVTFYPHLVTNVKGNRRL